MTARIRSIDYDHDGHALRGELAWNDEWTEPRPCVVVVHDAMKSTQGFEEERAVTLAGLGYAGFAEEKKEDGQRLWVVGTLLLFTTLFWTFFELAGSAITLYTERNVDRVFMGQEISSSMFQSVNPFFIILLAPAFSW